MNEVRRSPETELSAPEEEYRSLCGSLLEMTEHLRLCSLAHESPDSELEAAIGRAAKALQRALVWADTNDPDVLVQLVRGAWFFFRSSAREEARFWLERALAAPTEADLTVRGDLLMGLATVMWDAGEYEAAEAVADEVLSLRSSADAGRWADALILAASAASGVRDYERAIRLLKEAHALALETKNDWALRFALYNLGDTHYAIGDLQAAEAFFEEALHHHEASQKTAMAALTRAMLGHVAVRRGDDPRAEELLRETVTSVIKGDADLVELMYGLEGLAWVAVNRGDLDRAARLLGAADRIRSLEKLPVQDSERVGRDRVRSALDGEAGSHDRAHAEGYRFQPTEAAEYALAG